MKTHLLNTYAFNLRYANVLVEDLEEALMTQSPTKGLENHPAFTIGHLVSAAALTSKYLGGPYDLPPDWENLFRRQGPGDPRLPELDSSLYPEKEDLLKALADHHERVEKLILNLEEEAFMKPTKWRYTEHLPTMGGLLFFMCITHESMHLGQLAGWRRAMELPSALAKL